MYHLKKKFTKKVKRRTSRVNKKYNRKRVTKKIKLSRKKLNKKNKKNKRRRRSVKRGGSTEDIPDQENIGIVGGVGINSYVYRAMRDKQGGNPDEADAEVPAVGGNSDEADAEVPAVGGNSDEVDVEVPAAVGGKKKRRQRGGNGCPCGVV